MPHMVISYAKPVEEQVEIQKLVQEVWNGAEESGLFNPGAIKARALPVEHYVTANTDQLFIHVDAKLFVGRTDEQKQDMVKRVFDKMAALVSDDVSLSVEAIDMDKPNYIKR
ncbi:5-carboxymethyl-2-hydroxymuconate Delta-isomerase [Terasakiella sp. A23]|uniref:5-carboxymethyl-2-hydroxymuconate Delta-isomerase n=1 Tax=Terasakiella sp. FCG-A23 TaxID=3080561 RepID=UPI002955660C|nr:5-carboxymethyl-2-hydroxymuconate Delta-isomerase [Terasakiella sp. A23]MDV7341690.1 5-carboxymethyl-2-hydroxymuconate Delta-isomerase [Terasakiella sp. A23]